MTDEPTGPAVASNGPIDLDRPLTLNFDSVTGMKVYMFHDKPGVYYSAHGTPIAKSMAKRAGFDTDELDKEKTVRDQMATIERALRANRVRTVKVAAEKDGFKVMAQGDQFWIEDPHGNRLTLNPLTRMQAEVAFEAVIGEKVKVEAISAEVPGVQIVLPGAGDGANGGAGSAAESADSDGPSLIEE